METLPPFEQVLESHWGPVYQLAYRMVQDPAEAEEIAQQAFFQAFRAWGKFEGRSSVRTWLFRIALNAGKKHLLDRKKRPTPLEAEPPAPPPTRADDRRERVSRALERLSPANRILLTLFCIEGTSCQAIAETLGCPEGTVWSRLYRAKKELEEAMRKMEETTHA